MTPGSATGRLAALGALAVGLVIVAAVLCWSLCRPPSSPDGSPVAIEIQPGATVRAIGAELEQAGLVRSRLVFLLTARLLGAERELRAGRYELPRGATPWRLVTLLRQGVVELHQVTVPEGLTYWETAGLLQSSAAVDSSGFAALAADSTQAAALGVPGRNLEGYLFPETYDVPLGTEPEVMIAWMVAHAREVIDEELARRRATGAAAASDVGLSVAEMVTLASIVEAEAKAAEERPRIAAVYLNRLRRGWKLEADPTVLYALGERRRVLYRDLDIESPWNTYRVEGLPPTPICSPGRAAIRAVLEPEPDCQDLYFVARPDGTHQFSRTLAEHQRATREIRAGRR